MMQTMEIWSTGKCKCPRCGKFRKPTDFPDQPAAINIRDSQAWIHMHIAPGCYKCVEAPNAELTGASGAVAAKRPVE